MTSIDDLLLQVLLVSVPRLADDSLKLRAMKAADQHNRFDDAMPLLNDRALPEQKQTEH